MKFTGENKKTMGCALGFISFCAVPIGFVFIPLWGWKAFFFTLLAITTFYLAMLIAFGWNGVIESGVLIVIIAILMAVLAPVYHEVYINYQHSKRHTPKNRQKQTQTNNHTTKARKK